MTTEEIIRDLARQDAGSEGDVWPAANDALRCVRGWRSAAGQAGDTGVTEAIDDVGENQAAAWYADERRKLGR